MGAPLTKQEQAVLLGIARDAITSYLRNGTIVEPAQEEESLNQHLGCFVTLSQAGQLRGCIGTFTSQRPLCKEVAVMAITAATEDPRFYPMGKDDLDNFSIEISVLSPLRKTKDPAEISIGLHGIYLEKNDQSGVLLPQVAIEQCWDRKAFLQHTCYKAGLEKDDWQAADCNIYLFTAQIMRESDSQK
ncbi:MAG: AMMECR1 domain-containing protein [Desulfuromonadales bacterium C00003094]|jgi:AmmeMemoRadiSam system protein A|nr:MAG: AMMECR1 domain-containing protein [Desulfuromonadales bacterium C00003094]